MSVETESSTPTQTARKGLVLLLCLGLSGLPALVQAAPSANELKARSQFRAAQKSYDLGEFGVALGHYAEAYRLQPLPAFLFNMAQCHRQLGNDDKAAFFYQRFLDLSPESSPNMQLARDLLRDVLERKQKRAAAATEAPKPAPLSEPPIVEAPAPSLAPSAPPPSAALSPDAIAPAPQPGVRAASAASPGLTQKWWFWTAVGVAVVGAAGVGYVAATNPKPPAGTLADINAR